jgi:hypothetical protein
MKKKSNTSKRGAGRKDRPCLMAYTLNNTQPVICTIIADQPYFYMEEDSVSDDDSLLGIEGFAELERDLSELKRKMDIYERMSRHEERDNFSVLENFMEAGAQITSPQSSIRNIFQPVDRIKLLLKQSRFASALLDFANDHGVDLIESEQVQGAFYDREQARIFIHPTLGENDTTLLAIRELRRHWQHRKGAFIHPLTFHPDQAILINRAQEADLVIAMIRAAWEMQLAGNKDIWNAVEQSSYSDLARTFAREAFVDFRSIASGKACSAVFESWFLSERCRSQDKELIQAMLADHQGYVFSDPFVSRSVSVELIYALGEQPFGKNYLAPYAKMILEDPLFTEVRDRANANFLWFIKFERSFRETEQALQSEEGTHKDAFPASSIPSEEQGQQDDDHASASIIIPLYRDRMQLRSDGGRNMGSGGEDNIIHVRFGEKRGL